MSPPYSAAKALLPGCIVLACSLACGQDYPSKPIRIVTGAPAGGTDFTARLIAQGLTSAWGQQAIVDNRGNFTGEIVSRAPPDGYTLLVAGTALWLAPFLQDKVAFDPVRDFAPITIAAISPGVLTLHPSVAANSVVELIALAKARPGVLNYGSAATGTANHLAAELFKSMTGVNIVRVAYKSGPAQIADLLTGQVQLTFGTAGTMAPHVKAGRLKALAVTTAEPSALVPGLPTVAASGLPGFESVSTYATFVPARTPGNILGLLTQEIARVLHRPDLKEKALSAGLETVGNTPLQCAAAIKSEMARMGKVIKDAGIRAD